MIGLADRRRPGPAVRDLEVRRHARRPLARPPTAPASGSPRRRPGPTSTRCAARSTRSSPASAPCSPTTRISPSATPTGPWPATPAAAGGGGQLRRVPRPTPGCATTPHPPGSHRGERRVRRRTGGSTCTTLLEAPVRPRRARRAARGRADPRRGVPARRASSTRWSATSRPKLLGAGHRLRLGRGRASTPSPTRSTCDLRRRLRRSGLTCALTALPRLRRGTDTMFTGIVEELGEVAAITDLGDSARTRGSRGDRHERRAARRLDLGQRRLPDRGRRRRRHVHRRRDEETLRPLVAGRAAPGRPGQPGAGRHAVHPPRRPPRAGPRRRGRHDRRREPADQWEIVTVLAAGVDCRGTWWRRARSPSTASR